MINLLDIYDINTMKINLNIFQFKYLNNII